MSIPGLETVKGLLASPVVPQIDVSGSFLPCLAVNFDINGVTFEGRWEADGIARTPLNINRDPLNFWFFSPKDGLHSVSLLVGTHLRKNRCRVRIRIFDTPDSEIRQVEIDARDVKDNSWQSFTFEPIKDSEQKWFRVEILSPNANSRNFIAIWGAAIEANRASELGAALSPVGTLGIPLRPRRIVAQAALSQQVFIPRFLAFCGGDSILRTSFGWYGHGLDSKASNLSADIPTSLPFICPKEDLCEIQLLFGTYGRKNGGQVEFEICAVDKTQSVLRKGLLTASKLVDNAWQKITFDPIKESNGRALVLNLRFRAEPGDMLALWGNDLAKDSAQYLALAKLKHPFGYSASDSDPSLTVTDDLKKHVIPFPKKLLDGFKIENLRVLVLTGELGPGVNERFSKPFELTLKSAGALLTQISEEQIQSKLDLIAENDLIILCDIGLRTPLREFITAARHFHRPVLAMYEPESLTEAWLDQQPWFKSAELKEQKTFSVLQREKQAAWRAADFRLAAEDRIKSMDPCTLTLKFLQTEPALLLSRICKEYVTRYLPSFSIVTVLYGKENQVEFFLESILRQNYAGSIELILVDDCSPDRSSIVAQEFLAKARERTAMAGAIKTRFIKNETNIGNCASRDVGLTQATGEIVVIIDADCMLNKDFLSEHARAHSVDDCDVVIGPFNIETNGAPPLTILRDYESHPEWAMDSAELQDKINRASFLNCITRNFSIKRQAIKSDLFDPAFSYSKDPSSGFGWEDVEMGFRLYQQAARIKFIDQTFTIHVSHPSSVDEKTKPYRSLLNFRRLFEKHPSLSVVARRWSLETFAKICAWVQGSGLKPNEDWKFLESRFEPISRELFKPVKTRAMRILSYRWHCPHQYELHKLPFQFSLAQDLGLPWTNYWNYDQRPLRPNVSFIPWDQVNEHEFDLAILHFDENVLSPQNCAGVLEMSWGANFKKLRESLSIPMVAICHGTPQFYGQYQKNYQSADYGQVIEQERQRLVDYLGNVLVICNSHQAQREWGFKNSKVIWQGFDPIEYPQTNYTGGILSLGKSMEERPLYRGLPFYQKVTKGLPAEMIPEGLSVPIPDLSYAPNTNQYANAKYRLYVDTLRNYSVYFNPTLRSPMPRSRGEAMMCGLVTVSAQNHDVEMFIKNRENGFYSNDPEELREYLIFLCKNPDKAKTMGQRSRETAVDIFNHDRFLLQWQNLIAELAG